MSNTETPAALIDCANRAEPHPDEVQIIEPKEVELGADAMLVRRTLPTLTRSFVGAWCFVDHYGPEDGICMDVAPHPHTGLQTVSWLFSGEIEHRDSGGVHEMVLPGEVNLMTSGYGIAHSEVSQRNRQALHGVGRSAMGVRDAGMGHMRLHNPTDEPARIMLLGGEPFDEGIVMWWNFIGRSHEDIARMRQEWNDHPDDRLGRVRGYRGPTERLKAPELPTDVRLRTRFRRGNR